jgi:uncharacterized membrane protein YgcG
MHEQQRPQPAATQNTQNRLWHQLCSLMAMMVASYIVMFSSTATAQEYDPDAAAANCRQFTQSVRNLRELADRQDVLTAVKMCIDLGIDPPLKARRDYGRTSATGVAMAQIPGRTCPPFSTCLYGARVNESAVDPIRYNAGSGGTINAYDGLGGGAGAFYARNNTGAGGGGGGSGEGTGYGNGVGIGGGRIGSGDSIFNGDGRGGVPTDGSGGTNGGGGAGGGGTGGGGTGGGGTGGGGTGGGGTGGGGTGGGGTGGGGTGGGGTGGGGTGGGGTGGGGTGGGGTGGGGTGGGIGGLPIDNVYDAPQFAGHIPPEIPEHLVDGATVYFYGNDIAVTPPMNSLIYPINGQNYYADGGPEIIQEGHIMTPPAQNGEVMKQTPITVNQQVLFNFDDGGIMILPNGYVGVIGGIEVRGGDLILLYHSEDVLIPTGTKLYPLPMGSHPQGEHINDPEWEPYNGPPIIYPPNALVFNDPAFPGQGVWWVAP